MAGKRQPKARSDVKEAKVDPHEELAGLQQELAVALEGFIAASRETQRRLVEAHATSKRQQLEFLQEFMALAHAENEALDEYVALRRKLFAFLRSTMKRTAPEKL
jgi:ribosome-binding ATPase YchF (GTP1/OBG family)